MFNAFGIIYGIIVVVGIIVLLDWLAQRQEKRTRHHPGS